MTLNTWGHRIYPHIYSLLGNMWCLLRTKVTKYEWLSPRRPNHVCPGEGYKQIQSFRSLGWVLPYLGISAVTTSVLGIFNPVGSLFYTSTRSDWPLISAEKNRFVPIPFSSRDTRTKDKVGLFFLKMYYLTDLTHLYKFSPWFSIQLTPVFIDFRPFWPLIFTKP